MAKNFIEKDYFDELVKPFEGGYEINLVEIFKACINNDEEPDKTFNKISKIAQELGADSYSVVNGKTLKNFIKNWCSDKEFS